MPTRCAWLVVLAVAVGGCSRGQSGAAFSQNLKPITLSRTPVGLSLSAAVSFPADDPFKGLTPYSVRLYTIERATQLDNTNLEPGADLAVFERQKPSADTSVAAGAIAALGPNGIKGYQGVTGSRDVLIASRGLSSAALEQMANLSAADLDSMLRQNARATAARSVSNLPGIGSLPMPSAVPGYAVSYVGESSGGPNGTYQRSVVVGTYSGGPADLVLFDWWLGEHKTLSSSASLVRYAFPAFDVVGDGPSAPEAHLVVRLVGSTVTLVRLVGLDAAQESDAIASLQSASPAKWSSMSAGHRAGGQQAPAKLVGSSSVGGFSWKATIVSSQAGGDETLCLEIAGKPSQTACVTGSDLGPPAGNVLGTTATARTGVDGAAPSLVYGVVDASTNEVRYRLGASGSMRRAKLTSFDGSKLFVAGPVPNGTTIELEAVHGQTVERKTITVDS